MKALVFCLALFSVSCAHLPTPASTPQAAAPNALLQPSVSQIFAVHCVRCHSGEKPASRLDLSSYATAMRGGRRGGLVVNGDSGKSLLLAAVLGTGEMGQMPNQAEPLSWKEIRAVKRWIDSGASLDGFSARFQMVSMGGK